MIHQSIALFLLFIEDKTVQIPTVTALCTFCTQRGSPKSLFEQSVQTTNLWLLSLWEYHSSDSCCFYSTSDSLVLSVKHASAVIRGNCSFHFFFKRPVWVTLNTCAHILTWCCPINLAQRMDGNAMGYSPVETRRPVGGLIQTPGFIVAAFLLS